MSGELGDVEQHLQDIWTYLPTSDDTKAMIREAELTKDRIGEARKCVVEATPTANQASCVCAIL